MFASLLLIALADQARAPAPSPQEPPIIVKGEKNPDQKCRMTRELGSHLMKKVCRTDAEQRAIDTNARNVLRLGNVNPEQPGITPPSTDR